MKRRLYMLVSADEYELPLTPPETYKELKNLGVSSIAITRRDNSEFKSYNKFNGSNYRIVSVVME